VELTELALDFGTQLPPERRYELIRALVPKMSAERRSQLASELILKSKRHTNVGVELAEHARALIALAHGATDEERILTDLLEQMTQRDWWSVYGTVFVELIPLLPATTRKQAVATALRQCFETYHIETSEDLIAILEGIEVSLAFSELPRIRDQHRRATALATLMRRTGDLAETTPTLGDTDLLSHIPANCTPDEMFGIISASAWWIDCNTGTPGTAAIAETALDIVGRWT
jgi:hypothetical protein